jgi:hypothetical protein
VNFFAKFKENLFPLFEKITFYLEKYIKKISTCQWNISESISSKPQLLVSWIIKLKYTYFLMSNNIEDIFENTGTAKLFRCQTLSIKNPPSQNTIPHKTPSFKIWSDTCFVSGLSSVSHAKYDCIIREVSQTNVYVYFLILNQRVAD